MGGKKHPFQRKLQHARPKLLPAESEARHFQEAVLDAIPINLAILDEQATIVSVNGAWRRFAAANAFRGESLGLGMNYLEICETASARTEPTASQVAHALRQMLQGRGEEFTVEYPCHSPQEERWFMLRLIPFSHHAKLRIMAAHMEVTRLIQIEKSLEEARTLLSAHAIELERRIDKRTVELRSTIRSLEGVLYHVAHDLRGPLRAMEGFTSLLLQSHQDKFDEQARDYASRIVAGARRMDTLIEDLLNFGKVCVIDMPNTWVNLNPLIDRVLRKHLSQIQSTRAVVEVIRPLPEVWGNDWALEQALFQLLSNALKFVSPEVSPRIRIWAETKNTVARVWVKDNGMGISPEHCERVFRIFERLDSDSSSTGIGLAIVRKAVERLEGRVGVESTLGQGSRFWLELPRVPQVV